MLAHFVVQNFRSIREGVRLSMTPAPKDHTLPGNLVGDESCRLLASAVLYGANASGKSNILKALAYLRFIVENSATRLLPGAPTGVVPFRLDAESRAKPSSFEVAFIEDGVRYIYYLTISPERIHHEELVAYPKGQPQRWFTRTWTGERYDWHSTSSFKPAKDLQERTRDNALFLSVGAQFNHPQLSAVYQWFVRRLGYWDLAAQQPGSLAGMQAFTSQLAKNDPEAKAFITRMLAAADLGIQDIRVITLSSDQIKLPEAIPEDIRSQLQSELLAGRVTATQTIHQRPDGSGEEAFDLLADESAGTVRLFTLLGSLRTMLETGACVAIDEIDASMHPLLVRSVLGMLHDPEVNRHGAQAIMTSHDVSQLDQEILRRDQIWLTEKNTAGGTQVVPLTDYRPKQKDSILRGYLAGRYGGVPILPTHLGR